MIVEPARARTARAAGAELDRAGPVRAKPARAEPAISRRDPSKTCQIRDELARQNFYVVTVLYGPRRWSIVVPVRCCTTLESQTVCPFKCFELRLFAVHVVFDEFFRNGIGGHHNWHDSITTTMLNSYADFYDS